MAVVVAPAAAAAAMALVLEAETAEKGLGSTEAAATGLPFDVGAAVVGLAYGYGQSRVPLCRIPAGRTGWPLLAPELPRQLDRCPPEGASSIGY